MKKHVRDLRIFFNSGQMSDYLLRQWCKIAEESISDRGIFTAALSGGSSPADFYSSLAATKGDLPWSKTHIFFVDERFVPPTDLDSNYGLMTKLFLRDIGMPAQNIHTIDTNVPSFIAAAELYEKNLRKFFRINHDSLPHFDLALLGIGEDGHTASLFPGGSELLEKSLLALPVSHSDVKHERISLTLPVLNNAENVIFIAKGSRKAAVVRRVIADRDMTLPAANVDPVRGRLMFVLDPEAASQICGTDGTLTFKDDSFNCEISDRRN
jgi:6-phosphogluconolactonase